MVRLLIFDFDGTLADSADWFVRTLNAAASRFGFRPVSEARLARLRGLPNREIVREMGVPAWRMPAIARHFRAEAARHLDAIRLFPGCDPALHRLRDRGFTLAIVSSNSEENIRAVLGPELSAQIAHFGCGASLFGKPAKLRRVMRLARCAPNETLSIGDEERDIHAARSVGMGCAAVSWGYATRDILKAAQPDFLLDSFDDLLAVLAAPTEGEISVDRAGSG